MDFTCKIKLVDFGSLKALVSVVIGGMEIRGFKVIDRGNEKPWVSPPSREIIKCGKKEYYNIVRFESKEDQERFDAKVLEQYRAESGLPPTMPEREAQLEAPAYFK
jgi:DNA-binding cell septation regulator SpoVG